MIAINISRSGDMDLEIGIPNFRFKTIEDLSPTWAHNQDLELDVDIDDGVPSQDVATNMEEK